MTGTDSYSITPASNATADAGAINWAEGQPPSSVNNSARQWMADERASFNDLIWFQYGTGDQGAGNIAVPSVYLSGTSFTITGADVTLIYTAGRRVRAVGVSTGTIYGTIASVSYNSGNTKTTVVVVWNSGSLSNETLTISLSQIPVTGGPLPSTLYVGRLSSSVLVSTGPSISLGVNSLDSRMIVESSANLQYAMTTAGGSAAFMGTDASGNINFSNTTGVLLATISQTTGAYTAVSDARLKTVQPVQKDYRSAINSIWIGDYTWKETGNLGFGPLAQQAYVPLQGLGVAKPENADDRWTVDSGTFGYLALWGVKDLYAIIEKLEARIAALEARQ